MTQPSTRPVDPYAKLLEGRIVVLGTPLDDAAAGDVMARFMHLEHSSPDQDIALYINSPGGSFSAMTAVYDTMRHVGCDVRTYCLGQAGPPAALLLAAGTPGKRFALPGARVVLRQPVLTEPVRGQASDLAVQAAELGRVRAMAEEILVRHTGRTPEQVARDVEREKVLDARAALEYGLVDQVLDERRGEAPAPGAR
ncbi:ATP-dependent Clp protease proteolytic subunit [Streptomyces flavalbus]|uniref:ATP-dependent Clp protease proteolytic subunit n=1 Tax=Streptomyces flavalbus TaxID=2665155 RepID=A0ABW2W5W3_9ACTN